MLSINITHTLLLKPCRSTTVDCYPVKTKFFALYGTQNKLSVDKQISLYSWSHKQAENSVFFSEWTCKSGMNCNVLIRLPCHCMCLNIWPCGINNTNTWISRAYIRKGYTSVRFFLSTMRTPKYVEFMHEQTTIGIHEEEVPKLVYTLFWCRPVI